MEWSFSGTGTCLGVVNSAPREPPACAWSFIFNRLHGESSCSDALLRIRLFRLFQNRIHRLRTAWSWSAFDSDSILTNGIKSHRGDSSKELQAVNSRSYTCRERVARYERNALPRSIFFLWTGGHFEPEEPINSDGRSLDEGARWWLINRWATWCTATGIISFNEDVSTAGRWLAFTWKFCPDRPQRDPANRLARCIFSFYFGHFFTTYLNVEGRAYSAFMISSCCCCCHGVVVATLFFIFYFFFFLEKEMKCSRKYLPLFFFPNNFVLELPRRGNRSTESNRAVDGRLGDNWKADE